MNPLPLLLIALIATVALNAYINVTSSNCDEQVLEKDLQAAIKLVEPSPGIITGYIVTVNATLVKQDLVNEISTRAFIVIDSLKQPVMTSIKRVPGSRLITIEVLSQIPLGAKVLLYLQRDKCSIHLVIEPSREELEEIISQYSKKYNITLPEKKESEKVLIEILENITGSLNNKEATTEIATLNTRRIYERPSYYVGLIAFILSLLILVDYLLSHRASSRRAVGE